MELFNCFIILSLFCINTGRSKVWSVCSDDDDCFHFQECEGSGCVCKYGVTFPWLSTCNECINDDHCPAYAECSRKKCSCKWGVRETSNGIVTKCNECILDYECPLHAECSLGKCRCKEGDGKYSKGKLTKCKDPAKCDSDYDCPRHASCSRDKCVCKYGGAIYINERLISCDPDVVGIVCGVVGSVMFVAVMIGVIFFVRRRRRLQRLSHTTGWVVPSTSVPAVTTQNQSNTPMYPVQQYQPVMQAEQNVPYINNAYMPVDPPPPYTAEPTKLDYSRC